LWSFFFFSFLTVNRTVNCHDPDIIESATASEYSSNRRMSPARERLFFAGAVVCRLLVVVLGADAVRTSTFVFVPSINRW
jgi:hypothetical protein